MSPVRKSYVKSTVLCLVAVVGGTLGGLAGLTWLPIGAGSAVAVLCAFVVLIAAMLACAGAMMLTRHARSMRGEPDLFLELNRSREPSAILSGSVERVAPLRRWLARKLLGHDYLVGDLVEIKSWPEIRATLDACGCLEDLPFMPEMLPMCGQRARVFRCVHRVFDYRKSRRMRHLDGAVLLVGAVCDGSSHGGCQAACHTIWKPGWLRRTDKDASWVGSPTSRSCATSEDDVMLLSGTPAPRYICQLTQLHGASRPISSWSLLNPLRPLISGNVTLAAFVVGWLTYFFNELQHLRQGVGFPEFEGEPTGPRGEIHLCAGDRVVVRSSADIRATLNDRLIHRGMGFETDMLKHCGHRYVVQAEVGKLIDIVSGQMLAMKTPAYLLRGVRFSGERQLFNAQQEPLFWRSAWLQREEE